MSSNARWRRFKIVAPLDQGRAEEIAGGLRNALERGESLAKAKQSFLNAGYKPEEIDAAAQKVPAVTPQGVQQVTVPNKVNLTDTRQGQAVQQQVRQPLPTTTIKPQGHQRLSRAFIIVLIAGATLILIGAAILGLYWDRFF